MRVPFGPQATLTLHQRIKTFEAEHLSHITIRNMHDFMLAATISANYSSSRLDIGSQKQLRLGIFKVDNNHCDSRFDAKGFRIFYDWYDSETGWSTDIIHQDGNTIPSSRGCVKNYDLAFIYGPVAIVEAADWDRNQKYLAIPVNLADYQTKDND